MKNDLIRSFINYSNIGKKEANKKKDKQSKERRENKEERKNISLLA